MQPRDRAICLLLLLACGFTAISCKLVQVQLVQHDKYWRMAIDNHLHPEAIPARRGAILDDDGNVLAQTQEVYEVRVDGLKLKDPQINLGRIAEAAHVDAPALIAAFNSRNRYQIVAHDVDDGAVTALKALKIDSLIYLPSTRRIYPNGGMAAHLLGFVGENDHGLAGVEKQMDAQLCGTPGQRYVERDAKHNEIAAYETRETPAVDGNDVTLSIRGSIQHVVEDQLDQIVATYHPDAAYIILMDPHTGEILAMGSRPTFDPNDRQTYKPEAIRNRCLTDMVEPGSIFKMITLSAALDERQVNLDTTIFCENGTFAYGGRLLHDDEPHGWLTVKQVMAQSSNIGFAKIALNYVHEPALYKYATAFGIGSRTGLFDGQGESAGLLRPVSKWSALSITRVPMGQEVAATPLQIVTAMSAIANGGQLMMPQLTKQVTDSNGHVVKICEPRSVRQVISPRAAAQVAQALEQVTIDGTAKAIKISGYSFAGKTGTAQKFVNGAYSHTQFVSSFLGFLPARDPAFVGLVMVDNPKTTKYYGAEVSAPVFATVAKQVAQIMNLVPDQPERMAPTPAPAPVLSSNTTPAAL